MIKIINNSRAIILGSILILSGFSSCQQVRSKTEIKSDVCILSGSEAGFTAAIQASRMGKSVVLIEPTGNPGGMMSEGIVKDIRFGSSVEDPVAIAWWPPDTHHARRIIKNGYAYNEGFVFGGKDWRPFGISWRSLIPRMEECTNLITPTCPSSSYVAYGAIRILPTFMVLGQSAGCAAAIAVDNRIYVQDVDYHQLKSELLKHNQILTIPDDWLRYVQFEE